MKDFLTLTLFFAFYFIFGYELTEFRINPPKKLPSNQIEKSTATVLVSGTTKYIKTNSTGDGSGSDWDNAMGATDLKATIEAGGTIYVAAGTYSPGVEIDILNNVCIVGGYPAAATGLDSCGYDPINNVTTINGSNSHRIFFSPNYNTNVEIKGFVISNANSSSDGSVFFCDTPASEKIDYRFIDLVIKDNVSSGDGAIAIYSKKNIDNKILFQNCVFDNNDSDEGGALYLYDNNNSNSSTAPNNGNLVIEDCSFFDNDAINQVGGAIQLIRGNQWTIRRNTFCNNTALAGNGGAINIFDSFSNLILDCDFINNSSPSDGGAINARLSGLSIDSCDFVQNNSGATQLGGAVFGGLQTGIDFTNSNFYDNTSGSGGAIYLESTRNNQGIPNIISNCIFNSNDALDPGSGMNHGGGAIKGFSAEMNITNSYFVDNTVAASSFGGAINIQSRNVSMTNNLFFGNQRGTNASILGSDIIAYSFSAGFTPLADNKMQLTSAGDYLLQNGAFHAPAYSFSNDSFSNTDDGSLDPAPSISCNTTISPPVTSSGLACLTTSNCGCPSGAVEFTSFPTNHTIGPNEVHCLTNSQVMTTKELTIEGTLYIVNDAVLETQDGINATAGSNIIICSGSGFYNNENIFNKPTSFYNFGWMELCGFNILMDSIYTGSNSLTAINAGVVEIDQLIYQGDAGTSSYVWIDATTLNGTGSGGICLPGTTPQMIVEIHADINPTCATDCDGCPELANITTSCGDGSVQAAYDAIVNPIEVCNYTCPGTTGCTYLITGTDSNDYTVNSGEKICLDPGANYTGEIGLFGGTIQNCATAIQTFTYFIDASSPPSTFNNYGTYQPDGNIPIREDLTVNNYGTFSVSDLTISIGTVFNNFCTVNIGNSIFIEETAALNNYGCMDAGLNLTLEPNANLMLSGGCITAFQMFNEGTIEGTVCGNITITENTNNTSSGSIIGSIGFIDLSPPANAPFIDTNNGTVGGDVVWTSCTSCTDCTSINEEICDNGIDDDGDGLIDCADSGCNTIYYAATQTNTSVTAPDNILGAPDGLEADFGSGSEIVVDLGSALDIGEDYTLTLRYLLSSSDIIIEESIDGINFFPAANSPYTITSGSLVDATFTTSVHTRYLKLTPGSGDSFAIDAISYGNCICQPANTLMGEYSINSAPDTLGPTVLLNPNDNLRLDFVGPYNSGVFVWTGPNSLYQINDSGNFRDHLHISNIQTNDLGEYKAFYFDTAGCVDSATFVVNFIENCSNGLDDDGDGLIDCADEECCCAQAPTLSK